MLINMSDLLEKVLLNMDTVRRDSAVSFIPKPYAKKKQSYSAENVINDKNVFEELHQTVNKTKTLVCNIRVRSNIRTEYETKTFI